MLTHCQYNLSTLYGQGIGVQKDIAQATMWARKAAIAGVSDAVDSYAAMVKQVMPMMPMLKPKLAKMAKNAATAEAEQQRVEEGAAEEGEEPHPVVEED